MPLSLRLALILARIDCELFFFGIGEGHGRCFSLIMYEAVEHESVEDGKPGRGLVDVVL